MASRRDRLLPHNLEAEQAVLGAILVENRTLSVAMSLIRAVDFFRDAHQKIYAAMMVLADEGSPIDLVLLCERLTRDQTLDDIGGPAYVASLMDGTPRSVNVEFYAAIVKEKSRLRAVIAHAERTQKAAYDDKAPPAGVIVDTAMLAFSEIFGDVGNMVTADAAVQSYVKGLDTIAKPIPTGYTDLDTLIGGLRRGDFVIVAARPSTGKSSFGLGIARNIARRGDRAVFFSLEMHLRSLSGRLLAWESHVPSDRMERGLASDQEYAQITRAQEVEHGHLLLEPAARSMAEVTAWSRRAHQQPGGLACIVVDYIQLLTSDQALAEAKDRVTQISRSMKRLAMDLDIVVLGVSQLSRAPEGRKDRRPQPSDLRESGALEQDADVVVLLFREEMYSKTDTNSGVAEVIVAKNRNGPTGVTRMAFVVELAQFRDLAVGF